MAQNIQHCFILFTGCGCCSSSFYSFLCFCFLTRATRSTFCFASFLVHSAEDNSCVSHATCSTIQLCTYICLLLLLFLLALSLFLLCYCYRQHPTTLFLSAILTALSLCSFSVCFFCSSFIILHSSLHFCFFVHLLLLLLSTTCYVPLD